MDYILVSLLNVLAVPLFVRAVFNLEFCYKRIRVVSAGIIFGIAIVLAVSVRGLDETCFQLFGILITIIFLKEKTEKNCLVCFASVIIYSFFDSLLRVAIPFDARLFSNCFMVSVSVILYWLNRQKDVYINTKFLSKGQLIIFSFFLLVSGSFVMYDIEKYFSGKNLLMKLALFLLFLFTIIIFLTVSFQWMFQRNLVEYKHNIMVNNFKKQKEYYQKQIESNREISKIKHDMNNHFFVLHRYLGEKKFEKANKYLTSLINEFEKAKVSKYTNNDLLNIILDDLFREKKNQEVQVFFDGNFPASMEMDEVDFCVLFANVLKNAFEANELVPNPYKQIVVQSKTDNEKYWFAVSNPLKNKVIRTENNQFLSTKDKKSRGIGTQSIQSVVRKHGGDIEFVVSDKEFICRFIIPKKE